MDGVGGDIMGAYYGWETVWISGRSDKWTLFGPIGRSHGRPSWGNVPPLKFAWGDFIQNAPPPKIAINIIF